MNPLPQNVIDIAVETGRQDAERLLAQRAVVLQARAQTLGVSLTAAGDPGGAVLVAEGDSWFDYPWNDVLKLLEDDFNYRVESVAHHGDTVENMAYAGGQLDDFIRVLEKTVARGTLPKAVLLSGGGNDIAGDEFAMLLNHARSAVAGLNAGVVEGVLDERIRVAYITILSAVTRICEQKVGGKLPILVHGYDRPVPDGRGFLGGWAFLPGPWLEPGFRRKGFAEPQARIALMGDLIDRFNTMLQSIAAMPEFAHVRYVDLRGSLSTGPDYRDWWANELHPTAKGFKKVTAVIEAIIRAL